VRLTTFSFLQLVCTLAEAWLLTISIQGLFSVLFVSVEFLVFCRGPADLQFESQFTSNDKFSSLYSNPRHSIWACHVFLKEWNLPVNSPCMLITSSWDNRSGWLVIDLWRDDSTLIFFLCWLLYPGIAHAMHIYYVIITVLGEGFINCDNLYPIKFWWNKNTVDLGLFIND
jgi:hypothetical protein